MQAPYADDMVLLLPPRCDLKDNNSLSDSQIWGRGGDGGGGGGLSISNQKGSKIAILSPIIV